MTDKRRRVVVIGGGITGLAAAYEVTKSAPSCELVLVESSANLGGNVETCRREGFLIDAGPDSFLRTKPDAARLCEEVGLGAELIAPLPSSHSVTIAHHGKLVPMPAGMVLAVPTRLGPLLETPLLSLRGKLRILGDLFVDKSTVERGDETVSSFLERHFGWEATQHLAGPLLGGIFSGDMDELSIESTFPQLVALERSQGSLIRALFSAERVRAAQAKNKLESRSTDPLDPVEFFRLLNWLRREGKASIQSPFQSLSGGIGTLIEAIGRQLPPSSLRLGREVLALSPNQKKYTVTLDGNECLDADAVLLCAPAHAASAMLANLPSPRLSDTLAQIPYVSTATVFFAFERAPEPPLEGSGFIIPRDEGRLLASTYISSKWGGRAPEGAALLRVFLGGTRDPNVVERSSDAELEQLAREELARFLGPIADRASFTQVFRWLRSRPQPTLGHGARLRRIDEALLPLTGLALAGAAYDGVGLSDCIRQGRAAAKRVLLTLE